MEAFVENAFEVLNADSILEVLKQMEPRSVLSLCQSSKMFMSYCEDDEVFVSLMKAHYPGAEVKYGNAKHQYGQLTGVIGTTYVIKFDTYNNQYRFASKAYAVDTNQDGLYNGKLYFRIRGTKIRKGEKLWLLVKIYSEFPEDEGTGLVYETRADAVDDLVEKSRYDMIESIAMANNVDDEIFERVHNDDPVQYRQYLENLSQSEGFLRVLRREGFPNLDKQTLRAHFRKYSNFMYDDVLIMLVEFTVG